MVRGATVQPHEPEPQQPEPTAPKADPTDAGRKQAEPEHEPTSDDDKRIERYRER
jgi:hypothetical protein